MSTKDMNHDITEFTLHSGEQARVDYVELITQAAKDDEMIDLAACSILQEFDSYYYESRAIPILAQRAFEERDSQESLSLSIRRLNIYRETIVGLAGQLGRVFPMLAHDEQLWLKVAARYQPRIKGRYEEELARNVITLGFSPIISGIIVILAFSAVPGVLATETYIRAISANVRDSVF